MIDKQKEILSAALKLFVEYGFHGTPTSKIAQEAGVANGTLFHYFKTKDDLIVALYIDVKKRMSEDIKANFKEEAVLKDILKGYYIQSLYWAVDNKTEFYFVQQFNSSPFLSLVPCEILEDQTKLGLGLIQQGIKAKVIKPLPIDFLYTLITSHIYGVFHYLTSNELSKPKQKNLIADSFELLWEMIT